MPPHPPHFHDVLENIHHHKYEEDEFWEVISPTLKPLYFEHNPPQPFAR